MAEKLAENCGRQGDPCASTFQDGGTGTKAKRKKNKKRRGRKTAMVEKEHENKDDSPGSDEEYMDCSESASPESTKGEQKKAKLLETKEPKPRDDEKGDQNDPERTVESCPVKKEEKIKQEEPMDYEDARSHALDPPSKDAQSPPDSKDLQEQRDEKFADHTGKNPKDGNATQQPLGPQEDQYFAGGADTAASAGKRKKRKKKSRWDQTSPESKVANVKEEQGDRQVNPTSSTQSACIDASNRHAKSPVEVPKDEGRAPHQRDQHSKQLHKHDHLQREPIGRGKGKTDYHDSRGGHHHDRRSDRQYGEHSRGRGDSGKRDWQDHSHRDHRSSEAYHPQRGNWRRDGQEDYQRGPKGPRQEREYGRHGTDGNRREGNQQRPRRRSEERPKYTVGVAPDGKERFAFFFRGSSPFSQWHFCNFSVDGVRYVCAEQFMMHQKAILFKDQETAQQILQSDDPREQKQLGREVKNFKEEVWSKHCQDIVTKGNLAKFRQNRGLRKVLLDTDGMTLVEASPYDEIWGIGLDAEDPQAVDRDQWRGWNLLGQILTNVREQIIKEEREGKSSSRGETRDEEERLGKDREHAGGREEHGKESTTSRPVKLDRNFAGRQGGASQVTTHRVSEVTEEDDSGEKFHFFSEKKDAFLRSQHPCQFEVKGNTFSSAEQYMLYSKAIFYGNEDVAKQILVEEDVSKQKKLCKKAKKNMDEWDKSQLQTVMFDGNLAKFNQNPDLCTLLLETDGKALALTTDQGSDNFWGIGLSADDPKARKRDQWRGENVLGDILTRVRDKILQDRGEERSGQTDTSTAVTKEPTS